MLSNALKEKLSDEEEDPQDYQMKKQEEKIGNWKEMALHGDFMSQTAGVPLEDYWKWLRNNFSKKEIEGLMLVAQEQAGRTILIK